MGPGSNASLQGGAPVDPVIPILKLTSALASSRMKGTKRPSKQSR